MTLTQRFGLERNTFELVEDGIKIKVDSLSKGGTFVAPYTSLPHTPTEVTTTYFGLLATTIIMLGLTGICTLVWLGQPGGFRDHTEAIALLTGFATGLVFLTLFLLCRRRVIIYSDGRHAVTLKSRSPNAATVSDFVAKMNEAKLKYYEKCFKRAIDADPSINAKSAIVNLIQDGYLTEAQAENLEKSLDLTDTENSAFGFTATTDSLSA